MVVGLCTKYLGVQHGLNVVVPSVALFDPHSAQLLASRELRKDGLLGGVYGYLDEHDRVVIAEGHDIVRIGYHNANGRWVLTEETRTPLPDLGTDAPMAGVAPDGEDRVWFATKDSVVGVIDHDGRVSTARLGGGAESIANGLTGRPDGASVLTSHALYEVALTDDGEVTTSWRRDYDRSSGRKPGQLSWGSGTTPTVFGENGQWVAIVDNRDDSPQLRVFDVATGADVCSMPAFETSGPGTENSIIADGATLWIPSTYGFDYPPLAVDGPSVPADAPYTGGLTKIEVTAQGCTRVWENNTRIATLPMLTKKDHTIWALSTGKADGSAEHEVSLIGVDAETGAETHRLPIGLQPFDAPLQLTGMITPAGEFWQATATRLLRVGADAGTGTAPSSYSPPNRLSSSGATFQ
ncbi:hypothetical protein C3E79_08780 [Corynebacterium liangguodongii]|uniref:Uncharacterized protein n=2 Tax=Corynebacterium liangguodongii TaxID=2079535 RepID=A0A2S0WFK7_9CORY|nr:hypothetical protein C3E79_08780 [Corynebacterium liangguodongii]PWB98849.1 hypothetical protein DF219_09605 [Corynebacterium liangguodongii]